MSILSKLFGGARGGSGADNGAGETSPAAPQMHDGFSIHPDPIRDGNQWRISARIEKEVGGTIQRHHMVRADTLQSHEAAAEASLAKAKMLIDQQGETIFG
ncbi:MAG: HlyU family transcriptional regulator [Marinibacterium sp.]